MLWELRVTANGLIGSPLWGLITNGAHKKLLSYCMRKEARLQQSKATLFNAGLSRYYAFWQQWHKIGLQRAVLWLHMLSFSRRKLLLQPRMRSMMQARPSSNIAQNRIFMPN